MKWLPGDANYQRAAEDGRYTLDKTRDTYGSFIYHAWFTQGSSYLQLTPRKNKSKQAAMDAAERHYAATQRKAA